MIYVIGDIMLDRYVHGTINRMSPEAPVPILVKEKDYSTIGGAGNVALNIKNLTENVKLFGIIGNDDNGTILKKLISSKKINFNYIVSENSPTITKTRYLTSSNQVFRVDSEKKFSLHESKMLFNLIAEEAKRDQPKAILISDYNKQTIHKNLDLEEYIDNKKVIVDSKKTDLSLFQNAFIYKSNYLELCHTAQEKVNYSKLEKTLTQIVKKNKFKNMITTLAGDGCFLVNEKLEGALFKTKKVEVSDVTGAGDNFIATLAFLIMKEYNIKDAIKIALIYATESVKHKGNYFSDIMEIKE